MWPFNVIGTFIWAVLSPLLLYGLAILALILFGVGALAALADRSLRATAIFALALLVACGSAFLYGQKTANRDAEFAAVQLELAKEKADREIAEGALKAANEYARSQEERAASIETERLDYERQLQARPDPGCDALDDTDIRNDPLRVR